MILLKFFKENQHGNITDVKFYSGLHKGKDLEEMHVWCNGYHDAKSNYYLIEGIQSLYDEIDRVAEYNRTH